MDRYIEIVATVSAYGFAFFIVIISICFILVSLPNGARRLNDIGWPWALTFLNLIPYFNFIWWIVLGCVPSQDNNQKEVRQIQLDDE